MQVENTAQSKSITASSVASKTVQLIAAFMLGATVVYAAGFINTPAAHNAAHDTRHSQGFPCH